VHKSSVSVSINTVDVCQTVGDIAGDPESSESLCPFLVGQLTNALSVGILRDNRVSAKAKQIDHVR
jgi:hypothetical protein